MLKRSKKHHKKPDILNIPQSIQQIIFYDSECMIENCMCVTNSVWNMNNKLLYPSGFHYNGRAGLLK